VKIYSIGLNGSVREEFESEKERFGKGNTTSGWRFESHKF
jgi:hypothetical protein